MKLVAAVLAPALATALVALAAPSSAAAPAAITGDWKSPDGKTIMRFYQCGDAYCGRIHKFLVPEPAGGARDDKNPDKSKRSRKLVGLNVFWALKPDGKEFKGRGYNPEDGRTFRAKVSRQGAKLKVGGCVAVFCKSQLWTKA